MIDHRSYTQLSSCGKKLSLERDSTHDPCATAAVFYQLSYQANWELVTL